MVTDTFDIQELTNQTGVARRTIYFYVQQGLLPPPQGAGLAAYYTEDHLLRLWLIPILRRQGLRLDDIREKFQGMGAEEMRQLIKTAEKPTLAQQQPGIPSLPGPLPIPLPGLLPGWGEQRYTHYSLPGGITLTVPENLSLTDRQRLSLLLQAARQIFSGSQPKIIHFNSGLAGKTPDTPEDGEPQS
jgi:DNA-binding transcriptional MerR regulator